VLEVTLRTPARFPFGGERQVTDALLARVRGGKVRAKLEVLKKNPKSFDAKGKGKAEEIIWVLDERGVPMSSKDWATALEELADSGARKLCVWVGGAYGTPDELMQSAARKITLGAGTFPSWLACLVVAEQVYRADTIMRGTPYHHG